jgi:NTE family protein
MLRGEPDLKTKSTIMDARTPEADIAATSNWRPDHCDRVALVLQGGGALGAYQAGVYQALHEAGMEPDWVCGVSIGAINSAIIAGNPPEHRLEKLRMFWDRSRREKCGTTRRMATSIARPATSPVRG